MTSDTLSASDIANFLACQHLTNLDRAEVAGEIRRPFFPDPSLELLQKLGLKHEQKYLESLQSSGKPSLVEIPVTLPAPDAALKTIDALRSGADVVYQRLARCPVEGTSRLFDSRGETEHFGNLVLRSCGSQAGALHQSSRSDTTLLLFRLAFKNPGDRTAMDARGTRRRKGAREIPSSALHRLFSQNQT